jgi:hypothetical protein
LNERQKKALESIARRQKSAGAVQIDYSAQWLQQYGAGYSKRNNDVLRVAMSQAR